MNEPDDLGPELRSLVDEARPRGQMPAAALDRILGRLEQTLLLPPPSGAPTPGGAPTPTAAVMPPPPAPAAPTPTPAALAPAQTVAATSSSTAVAPAARAFTVGHGIALAIGLFLGAVGHAVLAPAPSPPLDVALPAPLATPVNTPPSVVAAPAPIAPPTPSVAANHGTPPAPPPAPVVASPIVGAPVVAAPGVRSARHAAAADEVGQDGSLSAERALLEMARTAASRHQTDAALDTLNRHLRRFRHGQLVEERESLWIQVLVGAGRFDEAQKRAQRFRHGWPDSILLPAVEETLRSIP